MEEGGRHKGGKGWGREEGRERGGEGGRERWGREEGRGGGGPGGENGGKLKSDKSSRFLCKLRERRFKHVNVGDTTAEPRIGSAVAAHRPRSPVASAAPSAARTCCHHSLEHNMLIGRASCCLTRGIRFRPGTRSAVSRAAARDGCARESPMSEKSRTMRCCRTLSPRGPTKYRDHAAGLGLASYGGGPIMRLGALVALLPCREPTRCPWCIGGRPQAAGACRP